MGRCTSDYLQAVYDAALSEDNWQRALSLLSKEISAVGAFIVGVDQVGLPFHLQRSSYPTEQLKFYFENFGQYDQPSFSEVLPRTAPMRLVRDCDVWGDIDLLSDRPDYKWMRETIGAARKGGLRLSGDKGWFDLLAIQFPREWSASTDELQSELNLLLPHIAKVVEINRTFSILRTRYQAVLAALDHVRIGICITDPKARVIVANSEAERILQLDDGLSLVGGLLTCPERELTLELSQKLRAISATAQGEGAQSESLVFATRASGVRPFMIEISPLRDSVGELERGLSGALVFVIDPENLRSVSTRRLSMLFGLTEAEGDVCRKMIDGLSANEIAETRSVSPETVRSQFKSVYSKTGTGRRADLVRLALAVDPPIGPTED